MSFGSACVTGEQHQGCLQSIHWTWAKLLQWTTKYSHIMRAISVCLNANLTTGTLKICKIFQICQFCGSYYTISSAKHRVFLQHLTKIKSFHSSNRIQTLKMYHLRLHAVIRLRMKIISVNTSETHIKIPSRTFKCTRRNLAYFCSRRDWWKLALLQTKAWKCGQLGDN